jgi:hypothetical protein
LASVRRGHERHVDPLGKRRTIGELLDDLERSRRVSQRLRASASFNSHIKPIREAFGAWRAVELTKGAVEEYITTRRAAGRANATINRETEVLRRALLMALEDGRIPTMPKIPRLPEDNTREGFFRAVGVRGGGRPPTRRSQGPRPVGAI